MRRGKVGRCVARTPAHSRVALRQGRNYVTTRNDCCGSKKFFLMGSSICSRNFSLANALEDLEVRNGTFCLVVAVKTLEILTGKIRNAEWGCQHINLKKKV